MLYEVITLGLGQSGEPIADRGEGACVGGGVRARRAADWRLVDVDDLVELLQPDDLVNLTGALAGPVEPLGEDLVKGVDDQGRLAGAGDPGNAGQDAERKTRISYNFV